MKYFSSLFVFLSLTIEAKLKIEISQGSKDLPKIAVVPFKSNLNEGEYFFSHSGQPYFIWRI